jgi:hypothetical protein
MRCNCDCEHCREEIEREEADREIEEWGKLDIVKRYYKRHPVGGCLHVVLSDGNTDCDCEDWCREQKDRAGVKVAQALQELSIQARDRVVQIINGDD